MMLDQTFLQTFDIDVPIQSFLQTGVDRLSSCPVVRESLGSVSHAAADGHLGCEH